MAHEAFALSPISARATQPSEEDYDAISAAFLETARGRWFLGEFAKRNRNADTHLVLDAVARVEQTLAAQNQPDPDSGRTEALAAIKAALNEARVAAALALDSLALEDNLAPVRKGARIIKEISWRWREIGADGRICDLIDSQLSAIEASCDHVSSVDPRSALSAAFDMVNESIAAFDEDDHAASEAATEAVSPSSNPWAPPSDEMLAAATARGRTATGEAEAAVTAQAMPVEPAVATVEAAAETIVEVAMPGPVEATATADVTAEAADVTANTEAGVTTDLADMTAEEAEAHDDAVLDLIAAEMGAPDPSDDDLDADSPETYPVSSSPTELEPIAATSEASTSQAPTAEAPATPAIAPAAIQPPLPASLQPSFEPSPASASDAEASPETSPEVSLGSTLIASGIVRGPATSATDPLAAIRRLSQAEKIALFS
jgi:hypothetical protein